MSDAHWTEYILGDAIQFFKFEFYFYETVAEFVMECTESPTELNRKLLSTFGLFLETWWKNQGPLIGALCPIFTSGYPPVRGRYVSDIDVNVLVPNATFLQCIFEYFEVLKPNDHRDRGYITVEVRGYNFDINIRFTINEAELLRTQKHSHNERILGALYPGLALEVARLKLVDGNKGMSTEPAWAKVLGRTLSKDEAYDYMAGPIENLIADAEKK